MIPVIIEQQKNSKYWILAGTCSKSMEQTVDFGSIICSARRNVPGRWKPILTLLTYILDTPCSLLWQGAADLIAARIPPGQNWSLVGTQHDRYVPLFASISISDEILLSKHLPEHELRPFWGAWGAPLGRLGRPWERTGVLGGHWEIPWRPWRSFGAILEVLEVSGVNPVKVEMMITR